jgi:small subunit ribosomal protein S6
MRKYELTLVLQPTLKEADAKKLLETIKGWMKNAKITKEDDWGQRPLAYEIKHYNAGHYYLWQVESEEGLGKDFETRLLTNDDIIRHLLLRTK